MVEVFAGRIEIINPGSPLIDTIRILDNPPRSRNEKLASLMRRLHICEEAGTGWDKMVIACEYAQLPAPRMTTYANDTRVTLYGQTKFNLSQKYQAAVKTNLTCLLKTAFILIPFKPGCSATYLLALSTPEGLFCQ